MTSTNTASTIEIDEYTTPEGLCMDLRDVRRDPDDLARAGRRALLEAQRMVAALDVKLTLEEADALTAALNRSVLAGILMGFAQGESMLQFDRRCAALAAAGGD